MTIDVKADRGDVRLGDDSSFLLLDPDQARKLADQLRKQADLADSYRTRRPWERFRR